MKTLFISGLYIYLVYTIIAVSSIWICYTKYKQAHRPIIVTGIEIPVRDNNIFWVNDDDNVSINATQDEIVEAIEHAEEHSNYRVLLMMVLRLQTLTTFKNSALPDGNQKVDDCGDHCPDYTT